MSDGTFATSYDIVIVGSGMGGGTLAYALRDSGARILIVERGDFIPGEPENWSTEAIFSDGRYRAQERWQDGTGRWYQPGMTYAVGGNTKVYGASLPRFRASDFTAVEHQDGTSPAWPITYEELEPYYAEAERLLGVHGDQEPGEETARNDGYPFPALEHEGQVQTLADRLRRAGYTPAHLPLGLDLRPGGRCVRCSNCDGYVCRLDAKADADIRCVRPALERENVQLMTNALARRIEVDASGRRATGVEIECDGERTTISAGTVVVSCGAVNSAALLLRSRSDTHPQGLANSSGAVGRNYMVHNNTIMLAVDPLRRNDVVYQKTLYINDFYERGTKAHPYPLGHMQLIGKVREPMVRPQARLAPRWARQYVTNHSMDWWLFSEDLPDPRNRVEITDTDGVRIHWRPNNVAAHDALVHEAKRLVHRSGYRVALTRRAGIEVCSHQAGTVRAGEDPSTSVLNPDCRAHDLDNLYVVDASFFPSLPVMNPALTIAANALRIGEVLAREAGRSGGSEYQAASGSPARRSSGDVS